MEDRLSHSENIQKGSQENKVTYEDVLRLHEVETLPFLDTPELKNFAVSSTKEILKRHDQNWIKQNRVRLLEELEQISEM
jgi:hypothetical protein